VLNSKWKGSYIINNWDKKWHAKSKKLLGELWELYKPQRVIVLLLSKPKTTNEFLLFLKEEEVIEQVLEDKLAHHLSQPKISVHDARVW
jgi:hypothetical protein